MYTTLEGIALLEDSPKCIKEQNDRVRIENLVSNLSAQTDITENTQMRKQVEKAAAKWQNTIDLIQDPIMILDSELRIVKLNAAAASFFNRPPEEILGLPCYVLMHDTDKPIKGCPYKKMLSSKKHEEVEIYDEKRNFWFLASVYPLLDATGRIIGGLHTLKDITEQKTLRKSIENALKEIHTLKNQREEEKDYLRKVARGNLDFEEIIAESDTMRDIIRYARRVAATDAVVLITGETGTGKELLAKVIHDMSNRRGKPMIKVSCSALPSTLIEGELFGREKGAYTGAMTKQKGRFEIADDSTIFLDEIGDLPLELQPKLLRVLQESQFERLGSCQTIKVNVRVIAATNRDLKKMVKEGAFRSDLFYRLNVFPIHILPLRERKDDILPLAWWFVHYFSEKMNKNIYAIPRKTMESLRNYPWFGNVRELRNLIERAMIMTDSNNMLKMDLDAVTSEEKSHIASFENAERIHLLSVLERTGWRIRGNNGAAEILDLKPTTLHSKIKKLGLSRPNDNPPSKG